MVDSSNNDSALKSVVESAVKRFSGGDTNPGNEGLFTVNDFAQSLKTTYDLENTPTATTCLDQLRSLSYVVPVQNCLWKYNKQPEPEKQVQGSPAYHARFRRNH